MALPVATKTWSGMLVNQRIIYVSLLATMGAYITGITNQLIAAGYTCVGSSNGVTAAMDGVNRCTTAAGFAVRATIAGAAQSWIVVSDGVTQTMFAYQGATDDICRISFSPGSLFVVAGTATFQPTATDEQVYSTAGTLIATSTSGDRIFHVWVDSTHRMWRSAIMRAGFLVGKVIGTELYDASHLIAPAVAAVPVWGFGYSSVQMDLLSHTSIYGTTYGGLTRIVVAGIPINVQLGGNALVMGSVTAQQGINLEVNGNVPNIRSLGLHSTTAGARGDYGLRIDWYWCDDLKKCGTLTSDLKWVMLDVAISDGVNPGILWPWDGVTATCTTT